MSSSVRSLFDVESGKLASTIKAYASPQKGGGTRYSEEQMFPAGMPTPLQIFHKSRSDIKVKLGIKVLKLIECLIGWEITELAKDQNVIYHL